MPHGRSLFVLFANKPNHKILVCLNVYHDMCMCAYIKHVSATHSHPQYWKKTVLGEVAGSVTHYPAGASPPGPAERDAQQTRSG